MEKALLMRAFCSSTSSQIGCQLMIVPICNLKCFAQGQAHRRSRTYSIGGLWHWPAQV